MQFQYFKSKADMHKRARYNTYDLKMVFFEITFFFYN